LVDFGAGARRKALMHNVSHDSEKIGIAKLVASRWCKGTNINRSVTIIAVPDDRFIALFQDEREPGGAT
jgi:hypothetical protein